MYDKRKNDPIRSSSQQTGAIILIAIGVIFLVFNTGIFSFDMIGDFFGMFGSAIGTFFGGFGSAIGFIVSGLVSIIVNLWPVILIALGLAMLFGRKRQIES